MPSPIPQITVCAAAPRLLRYYSLTLRLGFWVTSLRMPDSVRVPGAVLFLESAGPGHAATGSTACGGVDLPALPLPVFVSGGWLSALPLTVPSRYQKKEQTFFTG